LGIKSYWLRVNYINVKYFSSHRTDIVPDAPSHQPVRNAPVTAVAETAVATALVTSHATITTSDEIKFTWSHAHASEADAAHMYSRVSTTIVEPTAPEASQILSAHNY
jgi:hypothetical protein